MVLHGRTSEGDPPVWHCTHATRACREAASVSACTCRRLDGIPTADLRSARAWQLMQSRSDIPWV